MAAVGAWVRALSSARAGGALAAGSSPADSQALRVSRPSDSRTLRIFRAAEDKEGLFSFDILVDDDYSRS